jgi:hypothetical protein
MTAVFINEKLLGFIPKETPIYGNSSFGEEKQNDKNHAIIKDWLLNRCKHIFEDKRKTLTYLPDNNSEYNGCLIVDNKTLLRVTTKCDINLYLEAYNILHKASD